MKLCFVSLLILVVLPLSLFSESEDLEKWFERAKKTKIPEGVQLKPDPKHSFRTEFQPAVPSDKTTQLYAGRGLTNTLATDIFGAGCILYESNKFYFMQAGKENDVIFEEIGKTLQTAGISDSTLQALKDYTACRLKAPFGKPWDNWTEEEKRYWIEGECGWAQLVFTAIPEDIKSNADAYYFYWLGLDSTRLGVHVPHMLQEEGMPVQDLGNEIDNGINNFYFASIDPVNQKVTPEVAAAVRTIADMKGKLEGGGFPIKAIDQISEAAILIIKAASDDKLIE